MAIIFIITKNYTFHDHHLFGRKYVFTYSFNENKTPYYIEARLLQHYKPTLQINC